MSNLDDFFKKRDKKKKSTTTKTKFSTLDTEKLAKNLEAIAITNVVPDAADTEAVEVTATREQEVAPTRAQGNENLDEEWKPFDSEENKDYTGLRINTQTWKDDEEDGEFNNYTDENSVKKSCPWGSSGKSKGNQDNLDNDNDQEEENPKIQASEPKTIAAVLAENTNAANVTGTPAEPAVVAPTPGAYIPPSMRARMQAEAPQKPAVAAPTPGAYVPPSLRNRTADSGPSYEIPTNSVNYRRPNKSQPNLNDCLEFPSLDAGPDSMTMAGMTNGDGGERFEFAKKSAKIEPKNEKDSQIHIQNKFTALSSNQ